MNHPKKRKGTRAAALPKNLPPDKQDVDINTVPAAIAVGSSADRLNAIANLLKSYESPALSLVADNLMQISASLTVPARTRLQASVADTNTLISQAIIPPMQQMCLDIKLAQHDLKILKKNCSQPNTLTNPTNPTSLTRTDSNSSNLDRLIIIESYPNRTAAQVNKLLLEHPLITNGQAHVDHVNFHLNGNIYIHCSSTQCRDLILPILTTNSIAARTPRMKCSLFKLAPIPNGTTPEQLIDWLEQTDSRFKAHKSLTTKTNISIRINSAQHAVVLKVSEPLAQQLIGNASAHFKLTKIRVTPFIELLQCRRCGRFGHKTNNCKPINKSACLNCASEEIGHICPINPQSDSTLGACINCKRAKLNHQGHCAWEKTCTVRKTYLDNLKLKRPFYNG